MTTKHILISLAIIVATVVFLEFTLGSRGRELFFLVLGYFAFGWSVPDLVKYLDKRFFNKS
jgi:hypothetical protein